MDKNAEFKIMSDDGDVMYSMNQTLAIELAEEFIKSANVNEVKIIRSEIIWAHTKNVGGN